MTKRKFSYSKLTALCVAVAIVTVWGVSMSRATTSSSAPTNVLPDVNIASELGTLDSFGDDLAKFDKRRAQFGKKISVTNTEFNSLNNDHDALKQRLSQVPNAIRSIINKLKAAGKWETFDEDLLASSTDEKFKASVREFGGAKRLFEDAASQLGSSSAKEEILGSLDDLKKKVAADRSLERRSQESGFRLVAAAYNPPEPVFTRTAGCVLATIGYGARMIAHPFTSPGNINHAAYSCKCHGTCDTTE
ncbi:MAG TPA: hypothetical protein VGC60_13905 [Pyrinomonadaceae bacterium]|jgi:hypothetical protein